MKQTYTIAVHGCDDSTIVEYNLTEEEYILIKTIADKITEASTYTCMPTMKINKGE